MLVAVIDNYDSFTFNLVHYILLTGVNVKVFRNDTITTDELDTLNPDAIVLSPGPGHPDDAGISLDVIRCFSGKTPILGVCLGHQVIARWFGGQIIQARQIMHGKTCKISSDRSHIFSGTPKTFSAMRYHSLAIDEDSLPDCLTITSRAEDGEIMGIRHIKHPTEGVQFHPESFMTDPGKQLIKNFILNAEKYHRTRILSPG